VSQLLADRSVLVPMTLSDLGGRTGPEAFNFRRISVITLVSFDLEQTNSAGQHTWGGTYF